MFGKIIKSYRKINRFHVDNFSSAHVYLRLAENYTIDTIPNDVLYECLQITKDNSKDGIFTRLNKIGKKKDKVDICITMASNLRKEPTMEIGQIGYFDEKMVKYESVTKDNNFLKIINKTREERKVDHEAERDSYFKEIQNKKKKANDDFV